MLESWRRGLVGQWIALPAMLTILLVLAYLQYRWSGEASEALIERTRRSMTQTAQQFRTDFIAEISKPCQALRVDSATSVDAARAAVVRQHAAAARSDVLDSVAAVYLAIPSASGYTVEQVDENGASKVSLPDYWQRLEPELNFNIQARPPQDPGRKHFPCRLDGDILVMHHAIEPANQLGSRDLVAYVLIELRLSALREQVWPELIEAYFGSSDGSAYEVEILRGNAPGEILYSNSRQSEGPDATDADVKLELLGGPGGPRDQPSIPLVRGSRAWFVAVQHPEGSVNAVGQRSRIRNLAIGIGVLILLTVNMALLLVSTGRARQLARAQVDFVASVSHELRTPVTAICMMADNLASGVGASRDQSQRYGELLREQGVRLAKMIDDILRFSAIQRRSLQYDLKPLDVGELISKGLKRQHSYIEASGTSVRLRLSPDMPAFIGEETAVLHCLDNLFSNALKYANGSPIEVTAHASDSREVVVTIRDHGPGIPTEEQARIFDAFYRGTAARDSQLPGSGLGLSLVKQMVEGMGGRVTLVSQPGHGSAFSMHFKAVTPTTTPTRTTVSLRR